LKSPVSVPSYTLDPESQLKWLGLSRFLLDFSNWHRINTKMFILLSFLKDLLQRWLIIWGESSKGRNLDLCISKCGSNETFMKKKMLCISYAYIVNLKSNI
jgi:hypothetical protein